MDDDRYDDFVDQKPPPPQSFKNYTRNECSFSPAGSVNENLVLESYIKEISLLQNEKTRLEERLEGLEGSLMKIGEFYTRNE